jgi:hypothetical protein
MWKYNLIESLIDILSIIIKDPGLEERTHSFLKLGDKLMDISGTNDKSIRESKISDHSPLIINLNNII